MTAKFIVGDVFEQMDKLDDNTIDLVMCSPPFYNLRSYLPKDHPDKAKEIGQEPTPGEYIDTMLRVAALARRKMTRFGSFAMEIGDTYSGSGGAGGDHDEDGLRAGQPKYRQTGRGGAPLKSLFGIPHAFMLSMVYGRNILTGESSPAGKWLVRNYKTWVRSNPPVGDLGDKERQGTSFITVATPYADRWFDLDATRMPTSAAVRRVMAASLFDDETETALADDPELMGAPSVDWFDPIDQLIDDVIKKRSKIKPKGTGGNHPMGAGSKEGWEDSKQNPRTPGAAGDPLRGCHIRRELQTAGYLTPYEDAIDLSAKGYKDAHYAVWPASLVNRLVDEMCPRRVCVECGEPSRRIVENVRLRKDGSVIVTDFNSHQKGQPGEHDVLRNDLDNGYDRNERRTVGWTLCEHADPEGHRLDGFHSGDTWRPGVVLDPFVGSGTTLMVINGMGRDAVGIDLDGRNAELAYKRDSMFIEIERPTRVVTE